MANFNTEPIQVGGKIRLATWNCGGLSFTQRELCSELEGEHGRRSTTGSHGLSTAVCCVNSSPTTTRLNQRHVLVEGPSIWSLTFRLYHGIMQMGYLGTQV